MDAGGSPPTRDSRHGDEDVKVAAQACDIDPHTPDGLSQPPGDIDRIGIFGIVSKDVKEEHPRASEQEMLSIRQH